MANLNSITLIGRLTADPDLKYTQTGKAVASATIAVDRPKKSSGSHETDFIPLVLWEKRAETAAQYLHKGSQVYVEGPLQIRQYENRDGQKVRVAEVIVNRMQFLDSKNGNGGNSNGGASRTAPSQSQQRPSWNDDPFADDGHTIDIADDDLPF